MGHRRRKRHRPAPGSPPGTLIADPDSPKPSIRILAYGNGEHEERASVDVQAVRGYLSKWSVTWIDVEGLGDVDVIRQLGEILHLHALALEDTVNVHQRAKVDYFDDHIFIVARMVAAGESLETEQVSMFLGRNFVVTFQEGRPGDCFAAVRERFRKNGAPARHAGADYLAYCLLDALIDGYFPVLEELGEGLETLEDEILEKAGGDAVSRIHQTKRDLLTLRRSVWPLREAVNTLIRDATPLIGDETRLYLRDCYDHTVRIIDFVETCRELGSDLMDLYLTSVNNRMTEVMKVLTIIATIFIPLTFISSIYGMNFNTESSPWNMPELTWRWGYLFALGLMGAIGAGLILYFWRKGWLDSTSVPRGRSPRTKP